MTRLGEAVQLYSSTEVRKYSSVAVQLCSTGMLQCSWLCKGLTVGGVVCSLQVQCNKSDMPVCITE